MNIIGWGADGRVESGSSGAYQILSSLLRSTFSFFPFLSCDGSICPRRLRQSQA